MVRPSNVRNRPWVGLLIVIIVYLCLAFAISYVTPFNKGNDEGNNLRYLEFIISTGRLPITYEERSQVGPEANWPALYHLMLGWPSRMVGIEVDGPPTIKIFWDSFRYRAIDIEAENTWYLITEDFNWPYYGRILVLHLGRWLSICFSAVTLVLVYAAIREIIPDYPWLAVVGAGLLAFMPAYIFIGSVLNEDGLVAALATLYFWMLIKAIKQPDKLWPYWMMGLALGASVTTKYTTVIFPLEVVLVVALLACQRRSSWRWWLVRVSIVGGCAILTSSWWFGWSLWHLNRIAELGLVAGLLSPLFTGGTDETLSRLGYVLSGGRLDLAESATQTGSGTFGGWVRLTFQSMWGIGIGDNVPWSPYVYWIIGLILALALFGVWRLWKLDPSSRRWLLLMTFHLSIVFILPLIDFFSNRRLGKTAQGRHIFIPATVALVSLIVWGLATVLPKLWQRWFFPVLLAGLVFWTGAHIYQLATFQPPPLPLRTIPQAAEWLPHPLNTPFGEAVELVSYKIVPQAEAGVLYLTLAFRALSHINSNYLLDVTLQDSQGQIVSFWTGYNGQGRLPTLAWSPGDVVFDRLALPLPILAAGTYTLRIQLLDGQRRAPIDEALLLPVVLTEPVTSVLNADGTIDGMNFSLWRADGPLQESNPTYRYPSTIVIVTDKPWEVNLVDSSGRVWPPTRREDSIANFIIGPRWPSGDYQLQITSATDKQVISQPLLKVENWWPRQFDLPAEMEVSRQADLANQIEFLGYTLPQKQVTAGESFPVTLYWQAKADKSPEAHFIQFNHLLDSSGTLWGGYDRLPLEYYSTLLWAPGEVVIDGYTVPVDAGAPPGEYYLNVGYYLTVGQSAVNLPLVVDGQMTELNSVTIGPIEVIAR